MGAGGRWAAEVGLKSGQECGYGLAGVCVTTGRVKLAVLGTDMGHREGQGVGADRAMCAHPSTGAASRAPCPQVCFGSCTGSYRQAQMPGTVPSTPPLPAAHSSAGLGLLSSTSLPDLTLEPWITALPLSARLA